MQKCEMDWNDLKYVKTIAHAGSVADAARVLNVHQSTVFRRLNTLEKELGVRLFERLPNGYVMTAAGEDFCQAAERIEADIANLNRRISGQDMRPNGIIRVTTSDALFLKLLSPCFAKFRVVCPEIELEVLISTEVFNLTKRDADIAIRTTKQPPETLVGRRVAAISSAVYGSKQYLKTHPNLSHLGRHDWIGFDEAIIDSATARWLKQMVPSDRCQYRLNTCAAILAAVKANLGLAVLPCYVGDSESDLVQVLPAIAPLEKDLWILTHENLRNVTRIKTFIDFVASALTSNGNFLANGSNSYASPKASR